MASLPEKVRQLAPHWGVMFVLMFGTLALIERLVNGELSFLASMIVVVVIALAYPTVVRALGVAPPVWQRS